MFSGGHDLTNGRRQQTTGLPMTRLVPWRSTNLILDDDRYGKTTHNSVVVFDYR